MRRFLELEAAAEEFKKLKDELKEMIKAKAPQQTGRYQVSLKKSAGSRRPPWKDHFISASAATFEANGFSDEEAQGLAAREAEKVIEDTKPSADSYSVSIVDTEDL